MVNHHHVVEYVGSYQHEGMRGIILYPTTEGGNLENYLRDNHIDHKGDLLMRLFGCLSIGLKFLSSLRYKDIKTSNILIHNSDVLFTDFGSAIEFEDGCGTTQGVKAGEISWRYAASEILNKRQRNINTDLYALGCIFAEVLTVMGGKNVRNLHEHVRDGARNPNVQYGRTSPGFCLNIVVEDMDKRPHIVDLIQDMREKCASAGQLEDFFCERCINELEQSLTSSDDPESSSAKLVLAMQHGGKEEAEKLLNDKRVSIETRDMFGLILF
ncbi:kinase-like domain-containing protein [Triangularia setosa]|uniref:non-specific serine/threonine protein kinase n=1 Tax=Triangularia setosa TaxID=2587417 RepID=A0AAN6WAA4_9PEZI|nr:kinase-like domain-containing protein [Podospora setosa]